MNLFSRILPPTLSAHRTTLLPGSLLLAASLLLASCEHPDADSTVPGEQATAPTLSRASGAQTTAAAYARAGAAAPLAPLAPPESVEKLIARADAAYTRGQANYKAGHMEAAKDDFDQAVDILLRAPTGVQSDERLQAAFDRIVDGVHQLELQALKEGDGFTEQKAEPAPIDEANNVTFPVDPVIRAKAEAELATTHSDLPLMLTDPVLSFINYFSSRGHATIVRALQRRGRYADMISRIFREEGVPQDLVFLAQAESGFQPLALSRAGARGMWQFMPFAAQNAGLARNWWVDERQDPEKSTRAAARMLRDLHNQLGDWYLAMAAYNSGASTVQRAVQRTGYADFWELYKRNVLPGETRNYVPIILAMTIMAKNPVQYGLDTIRPDTPLAHDTVRINYPIDLRLVAECTDTSIAALQELNPSLLRLTTPKDMEFDLHLPIGTAEQYQRTVASIPEDMRVLWRYHRVERGETLATIARRYRTTASAIAEANNLGDAEPEIDSKLIIPVSAVKAAAKPVAKASAESDDSAKTAPASSSKRATRYTIRRGDTVLSVADKFGVTPDKLRQWNRLKGNALKAGHALLVYPATDTEDKAVSTRHDRKTADEEDATTSRRSRRGRAAAKADKNDDETDKTADKKTARGKKKAAASDEAEEPSDRRSGRRSTAKKSKTAEKDEVEEPTSRHATRRSGSKKQPAVDEDEAKPSKKKSAEKAAAKETKSDSRKTRSEKTSTAAKKGSTAHSEAKPSKRHRR